MKKRVLSLLIALCLVVGLIPVVSAEESASGTWDNITWSITDGVLTISGEGDIAYEIDEDHLYNHLYPYSGDITKIVVEEGITSLCRGIFSDFRYATEVSLPSTLTKIDSEAFVTCYGLSEIIIPANVTELGNSVFAYNWDLAVRFTGDAPKMKEYSIVDEEGDWGTLSNFHGTIYYPGNNPTWTEAYMSANYGYGDIVWQSYFTSGTCGENLTWRIEGNTLYIEGEGDMYDYSSANRAPWYDLTFNTLEIGPEVTSIGDNAFWGCKSLMTTNLGESNVRRIGQWAFASSGITSAEIPEGVTVLESGVFRNTLDLTTVKLPENLVRIDYGAFAFTGLDELTIPASVTSMGDAVFEYAYTDVWFVGDAPEFSHVHEEYEEYQGTFGLFKGSIYYPSNNPTWTEDITVVVNGWYEWIPYILNPFTDVPKDSFYHDPVMWAIENNITNGLTATEFGPTAVCNRAQVVTFLWRAAGCPEPTSTENPFEDVQSGSFYEKPVLWAVEKNITNGSDATHFNPTGVCNRAQVVTFLYRAFESPAVSTEGLPFADVPAGAWYEAPIAWAVEKGITNGLSATEFGPNASCNRAQVVTFLYRAYK